MRLLTLAITYISKSIDDKSLILGRHLAAKQASVPAPSLPGASTSASTSTTAKRLPVKAPKKDMKSLMKGIVVKKKPVAKTATAPVKSTTDVTETKSTPSTSGTKRAAEEDATEDTEKKAKTDST